MSHRTPHTLHSQLTALRLKKGLIVAGAAARTSPSEFELAFDRVALATCEASIIEATQELADARIVAG